MKKECDGYWDYNAWWHCECKGSTSWKPKHKIEPELVDMYLECNQKDFEKMKEYCGKFDNLELLL